MRFRIYCQQRASSYDCFASPTQPGFSPATLPQTISKGVDFRFESIRRLFYEEFLAGKDWEEDKVHVEVESCSFCKKQITEEGGVRMECNSHFVAHNKVLCGKEACRRALEKQCEDALKGASAGGRKKAEWAQARSRLSCPLPGCGMYMKETSIAPPPIKDEGPSSSSSVAMRQPFGSIPGIHHLTFNHRSTRVYWSWRPPLSISWCSSSQRRSTSCHVRSLWLMQLSDLCSSVAYHLRRPSRNDGIGLSLRLSFAHDIASSRQRPMKARLQETLDIIFRQNQNQQQQVLEFGAQQAA